MKEWIKQVFSKKALFIVWLPTFVVAAFFFILSIIVPQLSLENLIVNVAEFLYNCLIFKIPIYLLFLLIILIFLSRIIIKKIKKRRKLIYICDSVLHQIFQLREIPEKSLIYEYIEILKTGFGYEINNEILPEEKKHEFQDIIAHLLNKKLIVSKTETSDKGKLYKLSEKGRRYAKKKKWKVL